MICIADGGFSKMACAGLFSARAIYDRARRFDYERRASLLFKKISISR